MKKLALDHPELIRRRLLDLAEKVPRAWISIKITALLLVLEGRRPGWITQVLGLTRMSLSRWIHGVNKEGVEFLWPKARPGLPGNSGNAKVAAVRNEQAFKYMEELRRCERGERHAEGAEGD